MLGIDEETLKAKKGVEPAWKYGWVRFNVHFSFTALDLQYLIFSLRFVAENCDVIRERYYSEIGDGNIKLKKESLPLMLNSLSELADNIIFDITSPLVVEEVDENERESIQKKTIQRIVEIVNK